MVASGRNFEKSCEARDRSARSYDYPPAPRFPTVPTRNLPQLRREQTLTFQLRLVTPAFLGGAVAREVDPYTPLRVPSVRGQLRTWFRAAVASCLPPDPGVSCVERLRRLESVVFGDTAKRSAVTIAVVSAGRTIAARSSRTDEKKERIGLRDLFEVGSEDPRYPRLFQRLDIFDPKSGQEPKDPGLAYVGYGLFHKKRAAPTWIPAGRTFGLEMSFSRTSLAPVLVATVWLWSTFGGIGARCRRGWGSLHLDRLDAYGLDVAVWKDLCGSAPGLEAFREHVTRGLEAVRAAFDRFLQEPGCKPDPETTTATGHKDARDAAAAADADADAALRVLPQGKHVEVLPPTLGDALSALDLVGRLLRHFRGTRERLEREAQRHPDYYAVRSCLEPIDPPPELVVPRAVFGLPLNFRFESLGRAKKACEATVTARHPRFGDLRRIASPLVLRVREIREQAGTMYCAVLIDLAGDGDPLLGAYPVITCKGGRSARASVAAGDFVRRFFTFAKERAPGFARSQAQQAGGRAR